MDIKVIKMKEYNSRHKRVLFINEEPIGILQSEQKVADCIAYINGYEIPIMDGKIRRKLDKFREPLKNKK